MIEFYQTVMGKQFYQGTLPSIAKELSRIADALEKANALKEREITAVGLLSQTEGSINHHR